MSPYCHKCGQKLQEDDVFCGECGAKLKTKETTSPKSVLKTKSVKISKVAAVSAHTPAPKTYTKGKNTFCENCDELVPDNCTGVHCENCGEMVPDNCTGVHCENCGEMVPDNCSGFHCENCGEEKSNCECSKDEKHIVKCSSKTAKSTVSTSNQHQSQEGTTTQSNISAEFKTFFKEIVDEIHKFIGSKDPESAARFISKSRNIGLVLVLIGLAFCLIPGGSSGLGFPVIIIGIILILFAIKFRKK